MRTVCALGRRPLEASDGAAERRDLAMGEKRDEGGPDCAKASNLASRAFRVERSDYLGSSCRPTTVAPGPRSVGWFLKLRYGLDTAIDRAEKLARKFRWRAAGLFNRLGRVFGATDFHTRVPVVRTWRTLTPIVAPIFVVGSPRSGTTILGKILSGQREVLVLSEARPMWYRAVPALDERKFYWDGDKPCGRVYLDERDATAEVKRSLEEDFGRTLTLGRRRRLLEKMPINLLRVRWLRAMWPDAKFVHIIRDPFSTTASKVANWPFDNERQLPGIALRRRAFTMLFPELSDLVAFVCSSYEWYLFEWRVYIEEGERLARTFPGSYHFLRLEDLQRDPEDVLARICAFVDLRFAPRLRRFARVLLDRRIRMALPRVSPARCMELLGGAADRWGYAL